MNLNPECFAKIDPALAEALSRANPSDTYRVLITLDDGGTMDSPKSDPSEQDERPTDLEARIAFRKKLIDKRKTELEQPLQVATKVLRSIGLTVTGGTITGIVVAEGSAKEIRQSLEFDFVLRVSLDIDLNSQIN